MTTDPRTSAVRRAFAARPRRDAWRIPDEGSPPPGATWRRFIAENAAIFGPLGPVQVSFLAHVSLRRRCLYYDVPDVGSVPVKVTLVRLETEEATLTLDNPADVHNRDLSPLLSPVQVGSFARLRASPGFFSFTFVRNPFARLLAAFLTYAANDGPVAERIRSDLGRHGGALGFDDFVEAVTATPPALMDLRWMVQRRLLLGGRLPFDVVGRFERFDQDFAAIGQRLVPDFERWVYREIPRGKGARLGDHYDARLVEQVRRAYAEDFDAYGYDRDLPADDTV